MRTILVCFLCAFLSLGAQVQDELADVKNGQSKRVLQSFEFGTNTMVFGRRLNDHFPIGPSIRYGIGKQIKENFDLQFQIGFDALFIGDYFRDFFIPINLNSKIYLKGKKNRPFFNVSVGFLNVQSVYTQVVTKWTPTIIEKYYSAGSDFAIGFGGRLNTKGKLDLLVLLNYQGYLFFDGHTNYMNGFAFRFGFIF